MTIALQNLVETENTLRFRQTWNQYSKNWSIPKRQTDGKWVPINKGKLEHVVGGGKGYSWALWRMRKIMLSIKDEYGRGVWKVNNISTKHVVIKGIKYSIFRFDCQRRTNSLMGAGIEGGN